MFAQLSKLPKTALFILGAVSSGAYGVLGVGLDAGSRLSSLSTFLLLFGICSVLYAVAIAVTRRSPPRHRPLGHGAEFAIVILFALMFRLLLLPAGAREPLSQSLRSDLAGQEVGYQTFLLYDNDLWRHLWEAHALAGGYSPYRYTPAALEELAWNGEPAEQLFEEERWGDVFDNISFTTYTTVYPPGIQLAFLAVETVWGGSISRAKLLLIVADMGAIFLLAFALRKLGRRPREVVSYAWNPLLIKEVAGSGHADGLVVFLLALTAYLAVSRHGRLALASLGAATATKLVPILLLPLLVRRTGWRRLVWFAVPGVLMAAPFARDLIELLRGLSAYGSEWVFNSGPWAATRALFEYAGSAQPAVAAHVVTKAVFVVAWIGLTLRDDGSGPALVGRAGKILAVVVLLHPAVMPWYVLWALPFVCLSGGRSWLVFSCASLLSYTFYLEGRTLIPVLWIEYGLLGLALLWEVARRPYSLGSISDASQIGSFRS